MASHRRSRTTALEIRDKMRRRAQSSREQNAIVAQLERSSKAGVR